MTNRILNSAILNLAEEEAETRMLQLMTHELDGFDPMDLEDQHYQSQCEAAEKILADRNSIYAS